MNINSKGAPLNKKREEVRIRAGRNPQDCVECFFLTCGLRLQILKLKLRLLKLFFQLVRIVRFS
ncbi:unnamed protein product [Meloidogyne enterolobii]|uniref:Uncharacterized protein n=1 Tax=Meloidogyne enterolobii TaxID=390850 RepID=A0ACB0Y2Z6_MELEN